MAFDLVQIRTQATAKEDENFRFRAFLKHKCRLKPEQIDERVFVATRRVWAGIGSCDQRIVIARLRADQIFSQ